MIADDKPLKNPYDLQPQAGPSYAGADVPPPSYTNAQVAGSFSASRSNLTKVAPSTQHPYPYAPSPDGTAGPALSGDNVKGFMGHVKNFAPGKSPTKLLDPPPECFARAPPPGPLYGPFPLLVLVGKGTTLDRGFPYAAPACPAPAGTPAPHPFVVHDVTEADWRRFLHDVRIAGSLSPMNKVVSGLAPLALGVGIIFGACTFLQPLGGCADEAFMSLT